MKKLFLLAALFVAAAFSSCSKHDNEINDVEPPVLPDEPTRKLAIAFAEGNSLEFDAGETKIVHYTITGGNANNVVKAEMQTPDDAYTVETTPTSATKGTIAITAKTPPTENCVLVTVSDGDQSITAEITVSTNAIPEKDKLAITFAEGNSLQFDIDETKTVHYTITGSSANNVVKAELQNPDGAYALSTTPTSATEGTIKITAKTPTENRVIVTVSDGSQTIMAPIDVSVILRASFDGKTIVVETPGTLAQLLADYDTTKITELTVIGNLNSSDIRTLKNLPNLAILDMEYVNLEKLPEEAFCKKTSLTSVKLPRTLKTIGFGTFSDCSNLTNITIPDSVTSIGEEPFYKCSSLTSVTIGNSVTSIGANAFEDCSSLTNVTIPDGVTSIKNYTFSGCSSLTSITIPDSVTSIGECAFAACSSLTSVTIPDSVTSIGNYAFYSCSSLTSIYCKAQTPPTIESSAFNGVATSTPLYVPIGSADAYRAAQYWSKFTNINEMDFN